MRPSLPRPKPTASAVRQNPSREVCPFTCLFNQSRTLGRNGALATPLQSITSALFPMQRRGCPFPLHSPCVFSNFHTPTASLCFSRTLEGSTSTNLCARPQPRLCRGASALSFSVFFASRRLRVRITSLSCARILPFSTLNLRSEIQILSELLTSFSAPSCNSRRMNTCKSGSK